MSFILERQGHSASTIGLSAAMTPLGLIACSPFIPRLARRFGAGPLAVTCAALAALAFALIGVTQDIVSWFPLRFIVGLSIGPLFVLSETWIIGLAPPERRGRILGIYTAVISAGFALGPLSLMVVGTQGMAPFTVGITAFLACAIWLALIAPRLPDIGRSGEKASLGSFFSLAPALLIAVLSTAAFEQAVLSLLPVYGLSYGIHDAGLSALLTALIAGNILLQLPLGLAADRFSPRTVSIACALLTVVGCLLLPVLIETPLVWPLFVLWGACSFGIYTLALIELGARFSGAMLMAGNAAFALMWGIGGIAGPPATGAAMDLLGIQGLPIALGVLYLGLAAARLIRGRRAAR